MKGLREPGQRDLDILGAECSGRIGVAILHRLNKRPRNVESRVHATQSVDKGEAVVAYPVTHFEINAQDAAATQKFYKDLFGWGIDTNNPQSYGMIDTKTKGTGINGGIGASQDGRSFVTFYVETDDPGSLLDKAERLGGRRVMEPMDAGQGLIYALFADPEGNVIGLAKMAQAQRQQEQRQQEQKTRSRSNGNGSAPKSRAKAASAKASPKRAPTRKRTTAKKKSTASRSRRSRG
ncbi:MAG: VOC family protein [Chloroflexi bacterium]|nr:MAG: VOC family protein [Chloroflexota bacterium]TME67430.1 MAG: VOC family protein [Chloroflexota bacterium]